MSDVVLRTERLTKRFGELTAVDNLSLDVYEGEVFGFLGPNGAGKTTSINMICGLLKPDSGQVFIHEKAISKAAVDVKSRVGMCPQEVILWERLTCIEQLGFIGEMYGVSRVVARDRGEKLLEDVALIEKRDQQARTLSGGMRRRLNLIMALVHDPDIVVLDEPEAGLDPQSRVMVRAYVQSLARRKTVILTTHNMDEAERLADRIAIIDHGELLVVDTLEALKRSVGEGDIVEIEIEAPVHDGDNSNQRNREMYSLQSEILSKIRKRLLQGTAQFTGNILTVKTLDAVTILPQLLESVKHKGITIGEVRIRENTLEDVFIQLTGRRLRE